MSIGSGGLVQRSVTPHCHTPAGRRHRCPPGWYAPKIFICGEIISGYNSSYFPGKGWTCPLRWLVPGAEGTFSENWLHFSRKNQPSIPFKPHQRRPECISSIPSPQVLANQLINALTITRVKVSILDVSGGGTWFPHSESDSGGRLRRPKQLVFSLRTNNVVLSIHASVTMDKY